MASRTVCRFWQQGNCKFGDNCRFDHPGNTESRQSNNRFAPLNDARNHNRDDASHSRNPPGHSRTQTPRPDTKERFIDQDQMRKDLSSEQPIWILSCYTPRSDFPKQLFGGVKRELSPEEVRLRHYELAAQGRIQEAVQEAEAAYQSAKTQNENVLSDIVGAVRFLQNGFDEHPNRNDICNESTNGAATGVGAGRIAQMPVGPLTGFGQPSRSTFGSNTGPVFGQASITTMSTTPATSSAFGQMNNRNVSSGFGQASALGQPSTFGQASAIGTTTAFGRPSLMGQRQGFGQAPAAGNPFAGVSTQPSFGQAMHTANGRSTFGQQSGSTATPFGQYIQPSESAFGANNNPFAQKQAGTSNAAFGQIPSPFAGSSAADSGMQMDAPQGAFGTAPRSNKISPNAFQKQTNGIGSTGTGQAIADGSAFGNSAPSSGFGQANGSTGTFGAASQRLTNGPQGAAAVKGVSGKLQEWKGKRVQYVNDQPCFRESDGSWQRIWFSDGPPTWAKPEVLPNDLPYDEEVESCYRFAKDNGQFRDGFVPVLPPKREWTSWDF